MQNAQEGKMDKEFIVKKLHVIIVIISLIVTASVQAGITLQAVSTLSERVNKLETSRDEQIRLSEQIKGLKDRIDDLKRSLDNFDRKAHTK